MTAKRPRRAAAPLASSDGPDWRTESEWYASRISNRRCQTIYPAGTWWSSDSTVTGSRTISVRLARTSCRVAPRPAISVIGVADQRPRHRSRPTGQRQGHRRGPRPPWRWDWPRPVRSFRDSEGECRGAARPSAWTQVLRKPKTAAELSFDEERQKAADRGGPTHAVEPVTRYT